MNILPILSLLILASFSFPKGEAPNPGNYTCNFDLHDSGQTYPKRVTYEARFKDMTDHKAVEVSNAEPEVIRP